MAASRPPPPPAADTLSPQQPLARWVLHQIFLCRPICSVFSPNNISVHACFLTGRKLNASAGCCPLPPLPPQACAPPRAFGPNFSLPPPLAQQQQGRAYRPDHVDIDAEDREDPMACTTYVNDIFDYLRDSEVSTVGVPARRGMPPGRMASCRCCLGAGAQGNASLSPSRALCVCNALPAKLSSCRFATN